MNEQIGEVEWFDNGYRVFRETIEALAKEPEETCSDYGGYNVAAELVLDVRSGLDLCANPTSTLTPEQCLAIAKLAQVMDDLPTEVVSFTDVRSESLLKLTHPSWQPIRAMAQSLLRTLGPVQYRTRG